LVDELARTLGQNEQLLLRRPSLDHFAASRIRVASSC
jgi:hypothetical protein